MADDPRNREQGDVHEDALGYPSVKESLNWKVVIPDVIAFSIVYACIMTHSPPVLQFTETGVAYMLVTFVVLGIVRILMIYPKAYSIAYLNLVFKLKVPRELSIMGNSIESWLMWPVAIVIVAAISPANASYASAVTLFSGALALGILNGLFRIKFWKPKKIRTE